MSEVKEELDLKFWKVLDELKYRLKEKKKDIERAERRINEEMQTISQIKVEMADLEKAIKKIEE